MPILQYVQPNTIMGQYPAQNTTIPMYQTLYSRQTSYPFKSVMPYTKQTIREMNASGISNTMENLFNDLIQLDLNSAYFYLAMSTYLNRVGYTGFGSFLRAQYEEELSHAQTLIKYLTDRGGIVKIKEIHAQPVDFGSLAETIQAVLSHEMMVTRTYKQALDIAIREEDDLSQPILRRFISEQIDELAIPNEILSKIKLAGANSAALLILDQQYGQMAEPPVIKAQLN